MRKILNALVAVLLFGVWGMAGTKSVDVPADSSEPLYLGVLIQDNLHRVGTDMKTYREFVRGLPAGSHVAVAYARPGSIEVVQPFTDDLNAAAESLRPPTGSPNMAPPSPYVAAKEFMKRFPENGRKALLFASDGLDALYGEIRGGYTSNPYLTSAAKLGKRNDIAIYTIYVPSARSGNFRNDLISLGQGTLNYLSNQTGGEAFYSGSTYISAEPYLKKLREKIG